MTMEMDIGAHCEVRSCRQRDFLPFRCDGCAATFCRDHMSCERHNCSNPVIVQRKAPTCPLCDRAVNLSAGEDPNVAVEEHISRGCKRRKPRSRCAYRRCRRRTCVVLLACDACELSFCASHRFPQDHKCSAAAGARPSSTPASKAAKAATCRSSADVRTSSCGTQAREANNGEDSSHSVDHKAGNAIEAH